jgi:hypothetical protein
VLAGLADIAYSQLNPVTVMHFNPNFINVRPSQYQADAHSSGQLGARNDAKPNDVLNENVKRSVGQATGTSTSGLQLGDKKGADDVAQTMLDHIQRGLDQLSKSGASEERIQQRLEAAKEGIAKGYDQAEQQLDDMGLLDDDLKAEIAQGRSLIDAGLEQLATTAVKTTAVKTGATEEEGISTKMPSFNNSSRFSSQASQQNSMSLELMTKDGDRISLSFMQSASTFSYGAQEGHQLITAAGFEENLAWQMDVVGNLDEGEQEALSNLLQNVEKLSSSFFSGDLGGALEQAMQLGFDGNELASMSLNLRQESFSSVSRAYNSVQPQLPTPELESLSSGLLAYNENYLSALEQAKSFADPETLLNDLVDQLFPDDHLKDIFQAYNQGLQSAVEGRADLMSKLLT